MENIKKRINKDSVLLCIVGIIIFIIHAYPIKDLNMIYVLSDEFGYWSSAAYFAGLDWSNTTSNIAYYSYGYGILLSPLFCVFHNPIYIYKAALIINSILMTSCFFMSYKIIKIIFSKNNKYVNLVISICVSLYPAYIMESSIAWSESLIIFLVWMLLLLVLTIDEKDKIYKFIFIGILDIYLYMVHQRNLGIVLSVIFILFFMFYNNKINKKQVVAFTITIVTMLIIHVLIKRNIHDYLWLNSTASNGNDFSEQIEKIKKLFSTSGLIRYFKVLIGHSFYIGAATFMTAYVAIGVSLKKIIKNIDKKLKMKNNNNVQYVYIFLVMGFISTLGISTIFMSNPVRVDHVIYGRYVEGIIGPVFLLGLSYVISKGISIKKIIICIFAFLLLGILTKYSIQSTEVREFNSLSCSAIWMFYKNNKIQIMFIIKFFSIILICLDMCSLAIKNNFFKSLTVVIVTLLFVYNGIQFNKNIINGHKNNMEAYSIVNNIEKDNDLPIYFLGDENNNGLRERSFLQYLLMNRELKYIELSDLRNVEENAYIITSSKDLFSLGIWNDYHIVAQSKGLCTLWSKNSSENNEDYLNLNINIFNSSVGKIDYTNNTIVSDGNKGALCYGPYMDLEDGKYVFEINYELDMDKTLNDDIGYADISANEGKIILDKAEIEKQDFVDNSLKINIPVDIKEKVEKVEIRTYVNENVFMKVKSINVKKIE